MSNCFVTKNSFNKGYSKMSNNVLWDTRLSLEERMLLLIVLQLPDNWDFTIKGLSIATKASEGRVRKILSRLEDLGYLHRKKNMPSSETRGKITYSYNFYDDPVENCKDEIESTPKKSTKICASSTYKNSTLDLQHTETLSTNIISNNNKTDKLSGLIRHAASETKTEMCKEIINYKSDLKSKKNVFSCNQKIMNDIADALNFVKTTGQVFIKINGQSTRISTVRKILESVSTADMEEVAESVSKQTGIKYMRNYLISSLYNIKTKSVQKVMKNTQKYIKPAIIQDDFDYSKYRCLANRFSDLDVSLKFDESSKNKENTVMPVNMNSVATYPESSDDRIDSLVVESYKNLLEDLKLFDSKKKEQFSPYTINESPNFVQY